MSEIREIHVPDIGDFKDLPVIEVLVKPGDTVAFDDPLLTLESDKASMDVPSPGAGTVVAVTIKEGDRVSKGSVILTLQMDADAAPVAQVAVNGTAVADVVVSAVASPPPLVVAPPFAAVVSVVAPVVTASGPKPHASPSVRSYARKLGVDVSKVAATGKGGRMLREDVERFVKDALVRLDSSAPRADHSTGLNLLPWPDVDFSKFGTVEKVALSRIKKISGANLSRNWVMIPHVTNNDLADITDLEAFRVSTNAENAKAKSDVKVTMLAFVIKAVVAALKKFPEFNASLDGDTLVYKQYFNIGFAADTPNGLVVPVLKDADKKGIMQISQEMGELAKKARDGKLGAADMQGGCFSISSLGGIGGTNFTPIVNAPEVAILGLSRGAMQPVWNEEKEKFVPRLMLPLSLSYDHRVIDGASAARFNAYLGAVLADYRRILL